MRESIGCSWIIFIERHESRPVSVAQIRRFGHVSCLVTAVIRLFLRAVLSVRNREPSQMFPVANGARESRRKLQNAEPGVVVGAMKLNWLISRKIQQETTRLLDEEKEDEKDMFSKRVKQGMKTKNYL